MHVRRSILSVATLSVLSLALSPAFAALPDIYPDGAQAKADIAKGLAQAAREHKRVILDFGGNWCGDCHALATYFHDPSNAGLLSNNYVLVPVNIGRYDQNLDLAEKYQVPVKKGVPALAVLDAHGRVLYSQKNKEFESMRSMESSSVTEFLMKWRPVKQRAAASER